MVFFSQSFGKDPVAESRSSSAPSDEEMLAVSWPAAALSLLSDL